MSGTARQRPVLETYVNAWINRSPAIIYCNFLSDVAKSDHVNAILTTLRQSQCCLSILCCKTMAQRTSPT